MVELPFILYDSFIVSIRYIEKVSDTVGDAQCLAKRRW